MRLFPLVLVIALLLPIAARADGCDEGERPLTAAESAFAAKVRALVAALPKAPAGWVAGEVEVEAPEALCKGLDTNEIANGSYRMSGRVSVVFHRESVDAQVAALDTRLPARFDAELGAMQKRQADLGVELQKAVEAGDRAKLEALGKKLDDFNAEAAALGEKYQKPSAEKLKALFKDSVASVAILLNPEALADFTPCENTQPIPVSVKDLTAGYRANCPARAGGDAEVAGESVLLFGAWEHEVAKDGLQARARFSSKLPYTAVQTAAVRVQADEQRSGTLLKQVGFGPIRAALSH